MAHKLLPECMDFPRFCIAQGKSEVKGVRMRKVQPHKYVCNSNTPSYTHTRYTEHLTNGLVLQLSSNIANTYIIWVRIVERLTLKALRMGGFREVGGFGKWEGLGGRKRAHVLLGVGVAGPCARFTPIN